MAKRLDNTIISIVEDGLRNVKSMPLNLGGFGGGGGGVGGRPGGFVGRLPQYLVTYDTTEAATLDTLPSGLTGASGWSLVDNLNHIRYRLEQIEAGSGVLVVDDYSGHSVSPTTRISFSGAIVTDLGGGRARVTISGGGGGLDTAAGDARYLKLDASNDPITGALEVDDTFTVINSVSDQPAVYIETHGDAYTLDVEQVANNLTTITSPAFFLIRYPSTGTATWNWPMMELIDRNSAAATNDNAFFTYMLGSTERVRFNAKPLATGSGYVFDTTTSMTSGDILTIKNAGTVVMDVGSSWMGLRSNYYFEFGKNVAGKESNAGKIGYETFDSGYLNIVGAGTTGGDRKVKIYDKLEVSGNTSVGSVFSVDTGISKVTITGEESISDGLTWDGWQKMSSDTWTRTGNHTFTVSGDVTAKYRKGAKVRYKDGGGYEYGVILSSTYGAPNTTVTLITNTDYAMAATTITDKYLSYVENPEGFPDWFSYSSTLGGFSGTPTQIARFRIVGHAVMVFLDISGTSNATTFTATMPVTIQNFKNQFIGGFRAMDNGTVITATVPACVLTAGATTITFYKDWGATGWTAAGTKEAQITTTVEF